MNSWTYGKLSSKKYTLKQLDTISQSYSQTKSHNGWYSTQWCDKWDEHSHTEA